MKQGEIVEKVVTYLVTEIVDDPESVKVEIVSDGDDSVVAEGLTVAGVSASSNADLQRSCPRHFENVAHLFLAPWPSDQPWQATDDPSEVGRPEA